MSANPQRDELSRAFDAVTSYACDRLPDGYIISIALEYGCVGILLECDGESVDPSLFENHDDAADIVMAMVNYACGMAELEKSFDDEVLGD